MWRCKLQGGEGTTVNSDSHPVRWSLREIRTILHVEMWVERSPGLLAATDSDAKIYVTLLDYFELPTSTLVRGRNLQRHVDFALSQNVDLGVSRVVVVVV